MTTHRGRRGFAVSALAFFALAILAVGSHAGGKNEGPRAGDPMKLATAAAQKANLQGLRDALMPLLVYVKGGQPRDALRSLADGTGKPVSPAVFESLQDGVKSALEGLAKMPVVAGAALQSRDTARVATEVYGEAIAIAADAAAGGDTDAGQKKSMAAGGVRLLSIGDALFDQSRRLSGGTFGNTGDITVNAPAAVPDLDPSTKVRAGDEKAIRRALADKLRNEAKLTGNTERAERLRGMAQHLLGLAK